jgi:beta-glucosidase
MATSFPNGFLWGTATAAHQIEGGNWNCDWWAFEHDPGSGCVEPSGDACDSFHRYPDDIALVRDMGLGAYRFSIEWARIEPEDGEFSVAALDHYRRVCEACHAAGLMPVVTLHHFTTPRWMAAQGGWSSSTITERFAAYCERAVAHLGDLIGIACTINEPNVVSLLGYVMGTFPPGARDFATYAQVNEHFIAAHHAAVDVLRSGPGAFPVGMTLAMSDWSIEGDNQATLDRTRMMHEGQFLEAARGDDYIGVQAYSRTRLSAEGLPLGPEAGVPVVTSMGYEVWPQALEAAVRYAAEQARIPIYVTENGMGTDDDEQRIAYLRKSLEGLLSCIADGIDVRGYFHWSLLDNFEWAEGYAPRFGLVSVDRTTFARTPKPSAKWFGDLARRNAL